MVNKNRIVRVFNDDIHNTLVYVARLTKTPYQVVFNEFLAYIEEGHVFGEYSHHKLIERILINESKKH